MSSSDSVSASSPPVAPAERVFGLDLIRALAIGLVLLSHGTHFVPNLPYRFEVLWLSGIVGVELFFVLSGFLIGTILLRLATSSTQPMTLATVWNFWVRRWFRTVPCYVLCYALYVGGLYVRSRLEIPYPRHLTNWESLDLVSNLFFCRNLLKPAEPIILSSWSLAVEEWFYLLIPLVFFIAVKLPVKKSTAIFWALAGFITVWTMMRFEATAPGLRWRVGTWDLQVRRTVVTHLDAIAFGVLMAWLRCFSKEAFFKYRRVMAMLGLVCATTACLQVVKAVQAEQPRPAAVTRSPATAATVLETTAPGAAASKTVAPMTATPKTAASKTAAPKAAAADATTSERTAATAPGTPASGTLASGTLASGTATSGTSTSKTTAKAVSRGALTRRQVIWLPTLFSLGLCLLLPAATQLRGSGWLAWCVTRISVISYSLYLMQDLVGTAPWQRAVGVIPNQLFLPCFLLLSGLGALALHHGFEMPMTRLRERFSQHEGRLIDQIRANGTP